MNTTKKLNFMVIPIILAAFIFSFITMGAKAVHADSKLPKAILFGVPQVGGSLFVVGAGLSSVIGKHISSKVVTQSFPGMVPFVDGVAKGRVDVAVANAYYVYTATHGFERFKRWGPRPLRVLGVGHSSHMFFYSKPGNNIKTIKDLVGKKVAYISAVSETSTKKNRLMLEYYGIQDKVIALKRGSLTRTAEALIEGKIDAYGGPIGSHSEILNQSVGIVVVQVPSEVTEYIQKKDPMLFVVPGVAPKGLFGIPEDAQSCATNYFMFVKKDCSDAIAYAVTKAVYDHPQELAEIHRNVGDFTIKRTLKFAPPVAYHPGAIKYFKEKGVWNKKMDDRQNKLLSEEK